MAKLVLLFLLQVSFFVGSIHAFGLDLASTDDAPQTDDDRTLILAANAATGTFLGINLTQLLPLLALAAAALLPLLCLCALSALLLWQLLDKDSGYGGHESGYGSSYSQYKRALGIDTMDWEQLSIIDWVAMGEETFRKFDPSNLQCQSRLVCEIHQNVKDFGAVGVSFVKAIGFLQYLELLNLPDMLQSLVSEYMDAADKGRSLKKDCGDLYPDCEFSIKHVYDRYLVNKIH